MLNFFFLNMISSAAIEPWRMWAILLVEEYYWYLDVKLVGESAACSQELML